MLKKLSTTVLIITALAMLFALPAEVGSQCYVGQTGKSPISPTNIVFKDFVPPGAPTGICRLTAPLAAQNAAFCFPSIVAPIPVTFLYAVALPATTSPYCNWTCYCPPMSPQQFFTIDSSDGLPVELMDFTVE